MKSVKSVLATILVIAAIAIIALQLAQNTHTIAETIVAALGTIAIGTAIVQIAKLTYKNSI